MGVNGRENRYGEDEADFHPNTPPRKCGCGGEFQFDRGCGVRVCDDCGNHHGLARCYCGWSASGGDGRAELTEMGETIEPEDY
jgi:hypothetical protein